MIEQLLSPASNDGQDYIYFAKYFDGKILYEYDEDLNHLDFNSIEKGKVKQFGLIGNGIKLYWDIPTGIFHIGKNEYGIRITNGSLELPQYGIQKDLITFKMAHTDSLVSGGSTKSLGNIIDSYFVGFKMNVETAFVQILFSIPINGEDLRPFFAVRISNKQDSKYTAELLGLNGEDSSKFSKQDINLKDGKSSVTQLYFS